MPDAAPATHTLDLLPDMPPEPVWYRDSIVILTLVFVTTTLIIAIAAAVTKVQMDAIVGSLATVHATSIAAAGANRAMSRLPYSNAAKQPAS